MNYINKIRNDFKPSNVMMFMNLIMLVGVVISFSSMLVYNQYENGYQWKVDTRALFLPKVYVTTPKNVALVYNTYNDCVNPKLDSASNFGFNEKKLNYILASCRDNLLNIKSMPKQQLYDAINSII
jgi:hypothetical protein